MGWFWRLSGLRRSQLIKVFASFFKKKRLLLLCRRPRITLRLNAGYAADRHGGWGGFGG
jgi:hypothetical protein